MNRGRGVYQSCTMQLVVQAEGVPATAVSFSGLVHHSRWPAPGAVLPVTVDRANPQNVNVEWDEVQSSRDRSRQNAESLAATMRGEGAAAGAAAIVAPTVVNLSGRDLSQLTEEQKAKLRMLGVGPDALAAQQAAAGGVPAPSPPAAEDEGELVDERLERLERLAKLKDQGVLNDEEFQAQKRQILEG